MIDLDKAKLIANFFKQASVVTIDTIKKFLKDNKINESEFQEIVFYFLTSFFGAGLAKNYKGEFDKNQLKKGIRVEYEHTTCPIIAERIAKDHLVELPDYYTRLTTIEE